jgi:N-acetylmuramoyl-L-alanine amidase/Zinc carboxypeptidase
VRVLAFTFLLALLAPATAAGAIYGSSVEGRPLEVARIGDPAAPAHVLVVGSIHGDETAGHAVIARLRRLEPPDGVALWLVRTANPDGAWHGTRQNARGVDLNRNFPFRWARGGSPFDTYFPGAAPGSEPETAALRALIGSVAPVLTIYFHQHMRLVSLERAGDNSLVRAYARRVGLPARLLPYYRGTATTWQNHHRPGTTAFVVELPPGRLGARAAGRHARAVLALAARAGRAAAPAPAGSAAARKPHVEWDPIPFGRKRRHEMKRYSKRHYGIAKARLIDPRVIVEHYTASTSYSSAFNTFAADAPDVEFGELPGVCAHYVIDRDGTIHQLVSVRWRCRHTVGLNDVAIGIEHVGTSDADVMGRPRQMRASLRLTRWLMGRFGIRRRDVIGHSESLSSPYHHERVRALRDRTHGDFSHATMKRYRGRL